MGLESFVSLFGAFMRSTTQRMQVSEADEPGPHKIRRVTCACLCGSYARNEFHKATEEKKLTWCLVLKIPVPEASVIRVHYTHWEQQHFKKSRVWRVLNNDALLPSRFRSTLLPIHAIQQQLADMLDHSPPVRRKTTNMSLCCCFLGSACQADLRTSSAGSHLLPSDPISRKSWLDLLCPLITKIERATLMKAVEVWVDRRHFTVSQLARRSDGKIIFVSTRPLSLQHLIW